MTMTWLVRRFPERGSKSRPARTTVAGGVTYCGAGGGTHAGGSAATPGCWAASRIEIDATATATENTRDAVTVCLLGESRIANLESQIVNLESEANFAISNQQLAFCDSPFRFAI